MTTGRVSLWGSGRLEANVDAWETAPGSLSRLPGAHPSRRDGVQELRGLRDRRGRRPAQPSLRARPGESAQIVRGGFPPSEAIAGSRSEPRPREGRSRPLVHLHELRRIRRRGGLEMSAMRGGIRDGSRGTRSGEEDILDLVLCPVCGADNDPEVVEGEICGEW